MWLLLVTKEQSEGDYCSKTSKWDLYWLFFIGLVCGIEFAYQKGCFVRHFVVWADISQPESFWHRCWDGWLLVCHEGSSPLTCPLQSLLLWKQYLSQYSLLWNLPFVSWWQLDGWMDGEINFWLQTSTLCPKWSEMGLVWWQILCKDSKFLTTDLGKVLGCQGSISTYLLRNFCSEW